jgi:hypothetical protein
MKKEEGNIISDWLEIHGDPQIEIKVLNEVIDSLLHQQDELAIVFAEWMRGFRYDNAELYFRSSTKELLEIYKQEKGL